MENTNLPEAQPVATQTEPKKLPTHKGLMAIIILALVAGAAIWVYFILNQPQNLGPVIVPHHPKTVSQNQLAATSTSTQSNVSNWKTYVDSQDEFSFQYPSDFTFDEASLSLQGGNIDISISTSSPASIQNQQSGQTESGPTPTTVKIGQYTWQESDLGDIAGNDETYFTESQDKKIIVTFDVAQGALLGSADQNKVNQILSTFQFSNQSQTSATNSVFACGGSPTGDYKPIDPIIANTISQNSQYSKYFNQGLVVRQVCSSNGQVLLFLDYSNGYWGNATDTSNTELTKTSGPVMLGVSGSSLKNISFYLTSVPDLTYEGDGSSSCNLDSYSSGKILYICDNAGDSGDTETWYAYDTQAQNNIKVKYTFTDYTPGAPASSNQTQVYRPDLLQLFSVQK